MKPEETNRRNSSINPLDGQPRKPRLAHFSRRPNGEKEMVIKGRIHGEKIEERFTQTEIEQMFDNM